MQKKTRMGAEQGAGAHLLGSGSSFTSMGLALPKGLDRGAVLGTTRGSLSLSSLPASEGAADGGATAVGGRSADRGLRFSRGREPPAAEDDGAPPPAAAAAPPPHRLSDVSAGAMRLELVQKCLELSRYIACMLGRRTAAWVARSRKQRLLS